MNMSFENADGFINDLPIGVYKTDDKYFLIFKNNYINKLFCTNNNSQETDKIKDLIFPTEIIRLIENLEVLSEYSTFTYKTLDKNNNCIWIKNNCKKVVGENGSITIEGTVEDVTSIKLSEDLLKENEQKFRMLFDNAPLGYQSLDENGNFIEVNQAWCNTLGYQKEEIIGKWFGDLLAPEYKDKFRTNFPLFKKAGEINGIEFKMFHKNGYYLTVSFNGKIGHDLNGNFKQTHCILKDISNEKKISLELMAEKDLAQKYIDTVSLIILVIDKFQNIVLINKYGAELLGFTQSELIGINWFDNFVPAYINKHIKEVFTKIFIDNVCKEFYENEIIIKDEEIRIISWHNNLLIDELGNAQQMICAGEDITDKKAIEEKYQTLFETMAQGVVYQDSTGTIISANPAAERILGLTLDQMRGRASINPEWRTIHEDGTNFPGDTHPASYTLRTGKVIKGIIMGVYNPNLDNYVWIRVSASPLFASNNRIPKGVYATFEDITDMRNAQNALRKSEERYRTFLNSNSDFAFLKDDQYRYLMVNKAYEAFLGCSENDVIGKTDFELMSMEAASNCFKSDKNALSKNELIISHENVNDKIFQVQKFPVLLQDNKYGVGGYIRDVTILYNTEIELRESEEKYRIIVENQTELVVKVNNEGQFLFVSPSYCELFGKLEDELLGKNFIPLVHPDDQKQTINAMTNLYTPPYVCNIEQRAMTINGWRWLEWNDKSILNNNKEVISIIGVGRDVTQKKLAEFALRESEEKFKQIVENIKEIFWLRDINDGEIIYISPFFETIWDIPREKIYNKTIDIFDILHPLDKQRVMDDINKMKINKFNSIDVEYRILRNDGLIKWIHTRSFPIKNYDGTITRRITISEDITNLKETQANLERFFTITADLVGIGDTNGIIKIVNNAWTNVLGYSTEELIGKNFLILLFRKISLLLQIL